MGRPPGRRLVAPDKIAVGLWLRMWKEGAHRRIARALALFWPDSSLKQAPTSRISLHIAERTMMKFALLPVGAALGLGLALGGQAVAQNAPAKPAAAQPAPQQQQQQPPSKIDLVSPESQWAKFCAKDPNTGKDACATMRDFSPSADQPPVMSINVFELQGEDRRKLRLMLPTGTLLKPGFRVAIDKGDPLDGKYDICSANACMSEIDIGDKTLAALKKGQTLNILIRVPASDPSGRELTLNVPLKDFGPAFEGKPTDPKVLEEQRQQLQQQLQKKAEEQRKALEAQQQQPGAAPAPAAPAAPAAPVAPKQ
jgi:invasion protein IalB